ncbi:MAG: transrane transport protein [Mycobacterium sp.]|nr:transrane transport protein [Mycobacterium sp.]
MRGRAVAPAVTSPAAPPTRPTSSAPLRHVPDWLVLAIICVGQFMVVLDVSVVNVALPAIRGDLGFSASGLQWIVNAYTITFGGFLLLGGRAADLFGHRRTLLAGLALFTLASLVGGLAQGQTTLLVARGAQGLGGAVLAPATLTILTATFTEPAARVRALGIWSATAAGGGAAGSLLGGVLTNYLGWRWILFINIPVGVLAIVAARLALREIRPGAGRLKLDLVGALLVTAGLMLLVTGIVDSDTRGWSSAASWGPMVAGVVLVTAFVIWEGRVAGSPLLPLGLFRNRAVVSANAVMFLLGAAVFTSWYFLSLYLQNTLGYSALRTGLAFIPSTLAIVVGSQVASRLVARVGVRPIIVVGSTVSAVGLAWLSQLPVHGHYLSDFVVPSALTTLGVGLCFTPIAVGATTGLAREQAGIASGLITATRQVGGALGLAILATLAVDATRSATAGGMSLAAATVHGYGRAFAVAAAFSLAATVAAVWVPGAKRRSADAAQAGAVTPPAGSPGAPAVLAAAGTAQDPSVGG